MKETRVIEKEDLKIVLNLIKRIMDMKPQWNESLMDLYAKLYENYYFDNQDDFVSDDGTIEHNSLDELIWGLGMNLPSWDDQDMGDEFKDKGPRDE